jgi:FtsH-binding integral membrane protein
MSIAKSAALFFSIAYAVGFVWFGENLQLRPFYLGVVVIICALVNSLVPSKRIRSKRVKWVLMAFCAGGICALLILIYEDIHQINGPDSGAITMRLLFLSTFIVMGLEYFEITKNPEP